MTCNIKSYKNDNIYKNDNLNGNNGIIQKLP